MDRLVRSILGENQYIDEEKPWELAKQKDVEHLREVLAYQTSSLLEIADLLKPFLPTTADKIEKTFHNGVVHLASTTLFPKHDQPAKSK